MLVRGIQAAQATKAEKRLKRRDRVALANPLRQT
jgi:hypothetical protein